MLADVAVAFPSQNPEDYTNLGKECQWYEQRKASGSVVTCQFPSTTVVIIGAVALLGFIVLGRT
jgi:hypothetical protein